MTARTCLIWVMAGLLLVPPVGAAPPSEEAAPSVPEGTSGIQGKVFGPDGKTPLEGAVVHAYHLGSRRVYSSEPTDARGRYAIQSLPHGYVDLAVETGDGVFPANRVVHLPPAGTVTVSFTLAPQEPSGERAWWEGAPPAGVPGLGKTPAGVARVQTRDLRRNFWKSPAGIAVIIGGAAAGALAIAAGGEETPASPF